MNHTRLPYGNDVIDVCQDPTGEIWFKDSSIESMLGVKEGTFDILIEKEFLDKLYLRDYNPRFITHRGSSGKTEKYYDAESLGELLELFLIEVTNRQVMVVAASAIVDSLYNMALKSIKYGKRREEGHYQAS